MTLLFNQEMAGVLKHLDPPAAASDPEPDAGGDMHVHSAAAAATYPAAAAQVPQSTLR